MYAWLRCIIRAADRKAWHGEYSYISFGGPIRYVNVLMGMLNNTIPYTGHGIVCNRVEVGKCNTQVDDTTSLSHHHIVSATALIHRTARPSISAMSSLLGISPEMWAARHDNIMRSEPYYGSGRMWLRRTYSVCSHGSPTDVSLPGWQTVPSALG